MHEVRAHRLAAEANQLADLVAAVVALACRRLSVLRRLPVPVTAER